MPLQHIFIVYLIGTLIVFLPSFGLAPLFVKAGVPGWKAYVPFYNTWMMQTIAHRPRHWVFWQFIPVVGWFISPGIFIEFVKLFGKFTLGQHTLASRIFIHISNFPYHPVIWYQRLIPFFIHYSITRREIKYYRIPSFHRRGKPAYIGYF